MEHTTNTHSPTLLECPHGKTRICRACEKAGKRPPGRQMTWEAKEKMAEVRKLDLAWDGDLEKEAKKARQLQRRLQKNRPQSAGSKYRSYWQRPTEWAAEAELEKEGR